MAGVFVILVGGFVVVVGLRGTHTALFTSLFANTGTTGTTEQTANHSIGPSAKPAIRIGVIA